MSEHNPEDEPHRLPNTVQWRDRYAYALRAALRDAGRYEHLTRASAPEKFSTPHIDYMLRPAFLRDLGSTVDRIAEGLYQTELHTRYHRHRTHEGERILTARKHLQQAARALSELARDLTR